MKLYSKMPQDAPVLISALLTLGKVFNACPRRLTGVSLPCSRALKLANEGVQEDEIQDIGLENELSPSDGWVRISPYGDFPKERKVKNPDGTRYEKYIQRVDRPAAEALVQNFRTLLGSESLGKVKRFVVGTPIYRGHPDVPGEAENYPDKTRFGYFADLEARQDGLYGKPVLSADAETVLANEKRKYLSPYWAVRLTGQVENGTPVCVPWKLISAGLTHSPNIKGGEALANENTRMNELLRRLAVLLALANANEATEDQITAEITKLRTQAGQIPALENELAPLRERVTSLENENTQATNRLKSLRASYAGVLLGSAMATGRITPAEKPAWETALANEADFDTKAAELQALQPKYKTQSTVGDLGQRKVVLLENESDRRARAQELVAEKQSKGLSYDEAFTAVQRENPDLFKQMKQPGKQ